MGCGWVQLECLLFVKRKNCLVVHAAQVPSRCLLKAQQLIMSCFKNKQKKNTEKQSLDMQPKPQTCQVIRFIIYTTMPGISSSFSHSLLHCTVWYCTNTGVVCCSPVSLELEIRLALNTGVHRLHLLHSMMEEETEAQKGLMTRPRSQSLACFPFLFSCKPAGTPLRFLLQWFFLPVKMSCLVTLRKRKQKLDPFLSFTKLWFCWSL